MQLSKVPILGKEMPIVEWLPRIEDRRQHYSIDRSPAHWPLAKELLLTSTDHGDHPIIRKAGGWDEALKGYQRP